MTIWEFLRPRLDMGLVTEAENLAKRFCGERGRLIEIECKRKADQATQILAVLASGNIAVPVCEEYSAYIKELCAKTVDEKETLKDVALVMFTSGSCGLPKGVMLTHENIISNLEAVAQYTDIGEQDTVLILRPLCHVSALTGEFFLALYKKARLLFYEPPFSPKAIARFIEDNGVTFLGATPTVFNYLADALPADTCLKSAAISGERLSEALVNKLAAKLPNTNFYNVYGLTENSPRACALLPCDFYRKPCSVGKPVADTEIKIIDGQLALRSPSVMKGYYRNAELTDEKIKNGWLFTGDAAETDADGYLYIKGRTDDMIIRAGHNVYPFEIEREVLGFTGVKDCTVYANQDALYGQKICLRVVGDVDKDALIKYLRKRLPAHLLPTVIEVRQMPHLSAGGKSKRR